jgi:ATP-dependent DNA ligase
MLLLRAERLPEGPNWLYELKLDGYRALAINSGGTLRLRSRNNKSFDSKYPAIMQALAQLPDETVIDGEVVALDESGRPSFSALPSPSFRRYCVKGQRDARQAKKTLWGLKGGSIAAMTHEVPRLDSGERTLKISNLRTNA